MKTLLSIALAAGAALMSPLACAHAVLKSSSPPAGATVAAPREITLTFNERVEEAFSTVTLSDGAGKAFAISKPSRDAANPVVLRMHLPVLHAGAYSVAWAVAGHDGHRTKGNFTFTVK